MGRIAQFDRLGAIPQGGVEFDTMGAFGPAQRVEQRWIAGIARQAVAQNRKRGLGISLVSGDLRDAGSNRDAILGLDIAPVEPRLEERDCLVALPQIFHDIRFQADRPNVAWL